VIDPSLARVPAVIAALAQVQSALAPAGPQARRIGRLGDAMYIVATVVWVIVVAAMLYAVFRPRGSKAGPLRSSFAPEMDRRLVRVIGGATAATALILIAFLVADFTTGRAMASLDQRRDALVIEVRGHQWWWDVRYRDPDPSKILSTANEIHIPVGRPVKLLMTGVDVIHSFWVPSLHGKRDLIPGKWSETTLLADSAGIYRGQCAEFCGHQHAKMGLLVIADPPEEFDRWYRPQLAPGRIPSDSATQRGSVVFQGASCVMCHAIGGTVAGARVGPDLTHVGGRRTLAAAAIPNTRGWLAGWISDPQRIKPGTLMPPNQLSPDDLNALVTYLESLK
jgi:cytochrome c oxidase subunit 2